MTRAHVRRRRAPAAVAAAVAAGVAVAGWASRSAVPAGAGRWDRTNHRGDLVSMLEGPAWSLGAAAGLALAPGMPARLRRGALLAVTGAAVFGAVDDLTGRGAAKGLRGHLGALVHGELTTGGLKVFGIGATGVLASALLLERGDGTGAVAHLADVVVAGGVVAGSANLVNLLDLRPGRVLKVVLTHAPAVLAGGPAAALLAAGVGASAALLRPDLEEQAMLGDCGANAAGAVLGASLVAASPAGPTGRVVRALALAALVGATLASERVSFTQVIERTPGLRELDALGRRPLLR